MKGLLLKVVAALRLALSFAVQIWRSNMAVLRIVLLPRMPIRPGILAYHSQLRSEASLAVLANLITLTPGTFTVDVDPHRRTLYIHTIAIDDPEAICETIRKAFEVHLTVLES